MTNALLTAAQQFLDSIEWVTEVRRDRATRTSEPAEPVETAVDADGDEFALDFGFPTVAGRLARSETTVDAVAAREARERRAAEHRAKWYAEREIIGRQTR